MPTILSSTLTASILTQRMPVSEAFDKSQTAKAKVGIHNGFSLLYTDPLYPLGIFSSQYLKVYAGKCVVPVSSNLSAAASAILATVELSSDLTIDLTAEGIAAGDAAVYLVGLAIDYEAAVVNNYTGLVGDAGKCDASIKIKADNGLGWSDEVGILLGKFSRANRYLETISEGTMAPSDVQSENSGYSVAESVVKDAVTSAWLSSFRQYVQLRAFSNLRKRIRFSNLSELHDANLAAQFNTATMPLADITNAVAGSAGDLAGWKMPVNWWGANIVTAYSLTKIWPNVEVFEVFDSYFKSDVQLAFHRMPGHSRINDLTVAQAAVEATVKAYTDYGSKKFVFDGKGSTFEGNLTIDLVLDFTGEAHNTQYVITIKNLDVRGNLTINYGQSKLNVAAGALGRFVYENVVVKGNFIVRPWPQVNGVNCDTAVAPIGIPAWNAGMIKVEHYLNNAGNIIFTGYADAPGPQFLNYWRRDPAAGTLGYTKGPIIVGYWHANKTGAGAMAMGGSPWLLQGLFGFIFNGCSLPSTLGGAPLLAIATWRDNTYALLKSCITYSAAVSEVGYTGQPSSERVEDGHFSLYNYSQNYWRRLTVNGYADFKSNVDFETYLKCDDIRLFAAAALLLPTVQVNTVQPRTGDTTSFSQKVAVALDAAISRDISVVRNLTAGYILRPLIGKAYSPTTPIPPYKETAYRRLQAFSAEGTAKTAREYIIRGEAASLGASSELLVAHYDELEQRLVVGATAKPIFVDANIHCQLTGFVPCVARFSGLVISLTPTHTLMRLKYRRENTADTNDELWLRSAVPTYFDGAGSPIIVVRVDADGSIYVRNASTTAWVAGGTKFYYDILIRVAE